MSHEIRTPMNGKRGRGEERGEGVQEPAWYFSNSGLLGLETPLSEAGVG